MTRVQRDLALGPKSAAAQYIDGGVRVREGVHEQASLEGTTPARRRQATAPARKSAAAAARRGLQDWLATLKRESLPLAERRLEEARKRRDAARACLAEMPRLLRGYFESRRPVFLAGLAVVIFDGFVLHGALEASGLDKLSIWGTSIAVPMAIAAANHAFGVLAGAIGLATPPRHRLRMAAFLFVVGLGAMVVSFGLLMTFRASAADATNASLTKIAEGNFNAQLEFFVSPIWMGPLQVGGSLAAITLTAFWTMAKAGREHRAMVLAPAEAEHGRAERAVKEVEGEIEAGHARLRDSAAAEHDVDADGEAAGAEIAVAAEILAAAKGGEKGLGAALNGTYQDAYEYHDTLYRNGGVWRMALPSVFNRLTRRWRTPGPGAARASEEEVEWRRSQPSPGGDIHWEPASPADPRPENGHAKAKKGGSDE